MIICASIQNTTLCLDFPRIAWYNKDTVKDRYKVRKTKIKTPKGRKRYIMENYVITMIQIEMLEAILAKNYGAFALIKGQLSEEEIEESRELKAKIKELAEKLDKFRKENADKFEKIKQHLGVSENEVNEIQFCENGIELTRKAFNIDKYLVEKYKEYDTAWKLDIKDVDIKAVKKLSTEAIMAL